MSSKSYHLSKFAIGTVEPSPNVLRRLKKLKAVDLMDYPDSDCKELKEVISKLHKIESKNIFVGNGSDEIIDLIPEVMARPGNLALIVVPTFFRYEDACKKKKLKIRTVPMENLKFTEKVKVEILNTAQSLEPRLIFLCNPNNPTGKLVDKKLLQEIAVKCNRSLVVVDEAYMDFAQEKNSCVNLVKHCRNLIVLRSLSKGHGLPSLRVGFALANENLIAALESKRLIFNVNKIAQLAAVEALKDRKHLEKARKLIEKRREFFVKKLVSLGLQTSNSKTNILLVKHSRLNLFKELKKRGILVGDLGKTIGIKEKGYVRIGIRSDKENRILLSVLENICRRREDAISR